MNILSEMTEEKAREILGASIQEDGSLLNRVDLIDWQVGSETVSLDAQFFTVEQLIAIAWWMTNKNHG